MIISAYADTSVFGGVFDAEYVSPSKAFFSKIQDRSISLAISPLVEAELMVAPAEVIDFFNDIRRYGYIIEVTDEALKLQAAYISSRVLTPKWSEDALHVALATVHRCSVIVSWNFRHIVNFNKIPLYNAVNLLNGYQPIAIHSPMEVIGYEKT